jgi:tetratricopeptide (TPR) repeat protein
LSSDPTGSLATALAHTARLLTCEPALAAEQAREILQVVPGHAAALRLLGAALAGQGDGAAAIVALRRATAAAPRDPEGWRLLGEQLTLAGDTAGADAATAAMLKASAASPQLIAAALALADNRLAVAEAGLRARLAAQPGDVAALRMLAEVAGRLGRYGDAERLLVHALQLAPAFNAARSDLAQVLHRQGKPGEALVELDRLATHAPANPGHRTLRAAVLARTGDTQAALDLYAAVLADFPQQPKAWLSYGHALKAVGRVADSIAAYRTALAQLPSLGEAWWSLANLKTLAFGADDIAAMQRALTLPELTAEDRYHVHFALGKALEDAAAYPASFEHYAQGNALRRTELRYDAAEISAHLQRSRALFTREFFAARAGSGNPAPDPIFIVGLPRSGSTLLEQILSSHSAVEGTSELSDILSLASRLGGKSGKGVASPYPEALATLDHSALGALGREYLDRTRIQRHTAKPYFIDKMPNNFQHIGLIHLILPHAKIIDARRHPLGCGFSGFKQHFARGQGFTYSLDDIGRYYRDYVALMAHYDVVLPGRVHRVFYEAMVADPEAQIRALLAFCGLPFEAACLSFYTNDRAVRTPSSEQVRQPIYTAAVEHWQHYANYLAPLRSALGPVLDSYPAPPPL